MFQEEFDQLQIPHLAGCNEDCFSVLGRATSTARVIRILYTAACESQDISQTVYIPTIYFTSVVVVKYC